MASGNKQRECAKPTDPVLLAKMLREYDEGKTLVRGSDVYERRKGVGDGE